MSNNEKDAWTWKRAREVLWDGLQGEREGENNVIIILKIKINNNIQNEIAPQNDMFKAC